MTQVPDEELLDRARELAENVLFPGALQADRAGAIPTRQLDAIAEAGLYGASVHASPPTIAALIETLASGCLTTAFIWTQHLGACAAAFGTERAAHRFADDMIAGRLRGGVAFAHMLRPDPPSTVAAPCDGGWLIDGSAPWVTGWGHIDLVHAAARHGSDIVWSLLDAAESVTMQAEVLDLAAVNSTRTAEIRWNDHFVPADRVTRIEDHQSWLANYRLGLRNNGSFPLGVASRCCSMLGRPGLSAELARVRHLLDAAPAKNLPQARAEAALFAVKASTALVASVGGQGVTLADHAQRLHRESMFLLVQGQNRQIKDLMLERLDPTT